MTKEEGTTVRGSVKTRNEAGVVFFVEKGGRVPPVRRHYLPGPSRLPRAASFQLLPSKTSSANSARPRSVGAQPSPAPPLHVVRALHRIHNTPGAASRLTRSAENLAGRYPTNNGNLTQKKETQMVTQQQLYSQKRAQKRMRRGGFQKPLPCADKTGQPLWGTRLRLFCAGSWASSSASTCAVPAAPPRTHPKRPCRCRRCRPPKRPLATACR